MADRTRRSRSPTGSSAAEWEFAPAPIGAGGGFVTNIDIAADGSRMVCDTDVFNGYIREEGADSWRLLLRSDNLPASQYDPQPQNTKILRAKVGNGANNGTFGTRIAPSDPLTIYTAWNGFLYRSRDGGRSFVRTPLPPKAFLGDTGPSRRFNRAIDVHPRRANTVLAGTNGDGCYVSTNGFDSWHRIDLPDTAADYSKTPGKYLTAWDPAGGAWVHVFGTGLFHCAAGAAGPFLFAGGPATASCLVIGPDGVVYVCEFRTGRGQIADALHILRDGAWTRAPGTKNADQVAVDPFDPQHLVWVNENSGQWWQSRDGGKSSRDFGNEWRGEGESAWLSNRSKATYPARLLFDPIVRDRLWIAEGVGVNYCDLPSDPASKIVFHDMNAGISEFVATCGLSAAGNPIALLGVMDKGVWRVAEDGNDGWAYCPPIGKDVNASGVAHVRSMDTAIDDPAFVLALMHQDGANGWSDDWGKTFTPLPPPRGQDRWLPGGDCAVSTRDNAIIAQGNRGAAYWTKNGGRSAQDWQPVRLDGTEPVTDWVSSSYVHRDCIAADKTRPGVFAALVNNIYKLPDNRDATGRDQAGLWINRHGGEGAWEHTAKGALHAPGVESYTKGQFWQARLAYVPGFSGELLYAVCEGSRDADRLLWLTDDGRAKPVAFPAARLSAFDFGKPAPGQDRPAVYFYGKSDGIVGLFVSFDWFATPAILMSRFPGGRFGKVSTGLGLVGDGNVVGRCYLGFAGNGWLRADLIHASSQIGQDNPRN